MSVVKIFAFSRSKSGILDLNLNKNEHFPKVSYFPTDWNLCSSSRKTEPCHRYKEHFVKKTPADVLNYNFARLGLKRAIALQTATRLPREIRRRFALSKLSAVALNDFNKRVEAVSMHLSMAVGGGLWKFRKSVGIFCRPPVITY